ncbi:MAG TPA: TonB family protein [Candidatus Polarisedimenticolaceae bacterium]
MSNYTLLLIDYEPRSIERMRRPLEQAGIRVEVATDGAAGLEAFERLQPDAVIVEAMLPKRHGFEVCQEIKKSANGKRTPVIVTTGVYKGRRYRTQAMHIHGADEYLEKPLTDDQIVQTVKRFLADRPERPAASPASTPHPVPSPAPAAPRAAAPPPVDFAGDDPDLFEIIDESLGGPKAPPSVPKPPAQATARSSSVVSDLTEDEISARLDALLPSDPTVPTEVSWESGHAVGHLDPVPEPKVSSIAVAEPPLVEPIRDVAAEILADFPPMPEVDGLPDDLGTDTTNLDIATPRPEAQVFDFDAGRSARRKGRVATDPAPPKPVPELSRSSSAVAPVVEIAKAPVVATLPNVDIPLTETYEAPKRGLPIWVWVLAVAGLAAGGYFAFFRTPPSAADAAPALASQPVAPEPTPDTGPAAIVPPPVSASDAPARPPNPAPEPAPAAAATVPPPVPAPQNPVAKKPQGPAAAPTVPAPAAALAENVPSAPASETLDDPSLAVAPVAPAIAVAAPPKPAIRAGDLVSLNDADTLPIGLDKPAPEYTTLARTRRQEGTVVFEVLVDETGRVVDVRLLRGIAGSDLNEAAMNAARAWRYKPAEKDGVPVRVWRPEQVRFKL